MHGVLDLKESGVLRGVRTGRICAHCFGDRLEIVIVNREQSEAQLVAPIARASREFEAIQKWSNGRLLGRPPIDIAPIWMKTAAHIEFIWLARLHVTGA